MMQFNIKEDLTYYTDVSRKQLQNQLLLHILELLYIYSMLVSKAKSV